MAPAADTAAPSVALGASSVRQGGEVPFTATGFPAGATLSVKFDDGALLERFPVGADGSASGTVTVPADTATGDHWLRFLAPDPPTSLKVAFTVTAAGTDGAGSPAASSTTAPETKATETLAATSLAAPVSCSTIAWSAAAAAAGGAAGAAATTLLVVRRRTAGRPTRRRTRPPSHFSHAVTPR
ncbi:hypothetical protein ACIA6T_20885 [Streptomyces sp. NPDC051740]|uniref:hypothetical protein n=1 Tax=Streptomyces sp. NPDC051740 TaxID=3365673 RepID=UPI0037BD0DC9